MTMKELAGDAVPLDALHVAFGLAFSDYLIGPFVLSPAQWPQFLARQVVDLSLSRVLTDEHGEIQSFAFVAPRAQRIWRLAGMGSVPAARGSGAAPRLLDDFMRRARESSMVQVELEVFAQNERARKLYEGRGFRVLHELNAWRAPPFGNNGRAMPAGIRQMTREQAFAWMENEALARVSDLPLQVTPASLSASPALLHGWQAGSALLVFTETAADLLTINSLIDYSPAQADALTLVEALRAARPQHRIAVAALQRTDIGGQALHAAGFEQQPLLQLLMRAPL